jgi:integrase/recombinase XerD
MNPELWKQRFGDYLASRGFAVRSVESYTRSLVKFLAFAEQRGLTNLASLTRTLLEEYRLHLFYRKTPAGKGITLKTQSMELTAVRRFVRYLFSQDYLLVDVARDLEMPRQPRSLPRNLLSERQTIELLEAPDVSQVLGLRDRAILEVLYSTGVRNQECARLLLEHLAEPNQCLRVVKGKGGKDRVIPLGDEAELWLQEYLLNARPQLLRQAQNQHVFLSSKGRPLDRGAMTAVVSRWARKVGLPHSTPHLLRHCVATHMLKRGANLRYLQALLGHECVTSTERYTQVEISDLRKVVKRCHPRERP